MSLDELFAGGEAQPSTFSRPGKGSNRGGGGEEVLVRLNTEGDFPVLYNLVQCKPQDFSILATDGHKAWKGVLAHKRLEEMAKKVKMEVKELLAVTSKALTRENIGAMEFLYTTKLVQKGGGERLELVWKKHLVVEDIKLQLGSLLLEPDEPGVVLCLMLEHAVNKMNDLQIAIHHLEAERERLVDERMSALQRLDKCVSLKEQLESDLYGKFKLVLNEKKAKVRRLMESLKYLSSQQQGAKTAEKSALQEGGGERDDSEDTDKEDRSGESTTPSPKSKQQFSPPQTTSTTEGVSSLLKNNWQDESVSPPVKRRRREPRKAARQPEIPRPSHSTSSSSSTSERLLSAARTEESPEPDDLLHQL